MKRAKGKEIFLITALFLIGLYGLVYFLCPEIQKEFNFFSARLEDFARTHGYAGAFVISLVGAASLFIVIPYVAFVFLLAVAGLNIWWLSLLAGLGAALGEVISYFIGYAGGRLTHKHHGDKYDRIRAWIKSHRRSTPFIIFLFGLTPLPDDIIFIPLGLVRYNFLKAFIPGFLGKAIMILATLHLGKAGLNFFNLEEGHILTNLVTLTLTVLIIYGLLKINWKKIIMKENE